MRAIQFLLPCILLLAACQSSQPRPDSNDPPPGTQEELEVYAYSRIGDVRVTYYVKGALVNSAREQDNRGTTEQKELLHVLVNRSHRNYMDMPDHLMKAEERLIYNADMHDLLVVLRDQCGFFKKGNSINIYGDDPIARANADRDVRKVIAVEQIINGKVNTSYFARRVNEDQRDKQRAESFSTSESFIMVAISKAIPRGQIGGGSTRR
ncbi:MAG: hypothetical protein KF696_07150 [Planctomycetes bacterium]|nr:hypothetical protein [Planctomycetota bacterium]MCW8135331.1 hypothetical protein [Planctomycetota bacterium]